MASDSKHAHELLDRLEPGQLAAVVHLLQVMTSPFLHSLSRAEVDDQEVRPEIADAIERARTSISRGEGIAHEEVRREFGLEK